MHIFLFFSYILHILSFFFITHHSLLPYCCYLPISFTVPSTVPCCIASTFSFSCQAKAQPEQDVSTEASIPHPNLAGRPEPITLLLYFCLMFPFCFHGGFLSVLVPGPRARFTQIQFIVLRFSRGKFQFRSRPVLRSFCLIFFHLFDFIFNSSYILRPYRQTRWVPTSNIITRPQEGILRPPFFLWSGILAKLS